MAGKSRDKMDLDLYADLENPFFPVTKPDSEATSNEGSTPSSSHLQLKTELKQIKNVNTRLTVQNTALKKNISCLYKTARLELERKESSIESLQQRIMTLEAVIHHRVQNFSGTNPSTSDRNNDHCQPAMDKKHSTQPLSCQSPYHNRFTTSVTGKRPRDKDKGADRLGTGTEYNRETKRLSNRDTVPERPRKRARSPDHGRQTTTAKRHCERDYAPRKKTVTARHRDGLYSTSCHMSDKELSPSRRKPWIY